MEERGSEDSTLVLDSEIAGFDIRDPDIELINRTADLSMRVCGSEIGLAELAGGRRDLREIGENITRVLSEPGNMRFDRDLRAEILGIFCRFAAAVAGAGDEELAANEDLKRRVALREFEMEQRERMAESSALELTNSQVKTISMQEKLERRKAEVAELRRKVREQQERIAELEMERGGERSEEGVDRKRVQRMEKALCDLAKQYEQQSLTLAQVCQVNARVKDVLRHQGEVIERYEKEMGRVVEIRDKMKGGVANLESELGEAKKLLEMTQEELKSERESFRERSFLSEAPKGDEEGGKVMNLLRGLIRFVADIGDSSELVLRPLDPVSSESVKGVLEASIARVRQFISENGLDAANVTVESDELESVSKEALSAMNYTLWKCCERAKEDRKRLQSLRDRLKFRGSDDKLVSSIVEQRAGFERIISDAMRCIGERVSENCIAVLMKYLRDSRIVMKGCDTELRELLNFKGPLKEIPKIACDFIRNQKREHENKLQATVDDLETRMAGLKSEMAAKDAAITSFDEKMAVEEQRHQEEKRDLEIKLKQSIISQKSLSLSSELVHPDRSMMAEEEVEGLKREVTRLKTLLDQRSKRFEESLAQALEIERQKQKMKQDVETQEREAKDLEAKEANAELKRKLREARQEMKEMQESFSTTSSKQAKLISKLKVDNSKLAEAVKELKSRRQAPKPEDRIVSLENDKRVLESQVEILKDKCAQVKCNRDSFWKGELERVETDLTRSNDERLRTERECHSRFIERIMEIVRGSVPVVQDISESSALAAVRYLTKQTHDYEMEMRTLQAMVLRDEPSCPPADDGSDWREWADGLYKMASHSSSTEKSEKVVRDYISDVVLSSVAGQTMADKLENLKAQKKILKMLPTTIQRKSRPELRAVMLTAMAMVRMRRKAGYSMLYINV